MAKVNVRTLMVVFITDNGLMVRNMVMDNLICLMEMFIKVNSNQTKGMAKANIHGLLGGFTMVNGLMVVKMVTDSINVLTEMFI